MTEKRTPKAYFEKGQVHLGKTKRFEFTNASDGRFAWAKFALRIQGHPRDNELAILDHVVVRFFVDPADPTVVTEQGMSYSQVALGDVDFPGTLCQEPASLSLPRTLFVPPGAKFGVEVEYSANGKREWSLLELRPTLIGLAHVG